MDFSKGLVPNRTYPVEYYMGEFYIKDGDERVLIVNTDISKATILYSLPSNSSVPAWTEKELTNPIKPDNISIVLKFWAKYKPGIEVTGHIKDGFFYEDIKGNEA